MYPKVMPAVNNVSGSPGFRQLAISGMKGEGINHGNRPRRRSVCNAYRFSSPLPMNTEVFTTNRTNVSTRYFFR